MTRHSKDKFESQSLFRREAVAAAKGTSLSESRIARPWAVTAIAAACLPPLAILVAIFLSYTYKRPQYADGIVGKRSSIECAIGHRAELVGVIKIDEISLARIRQGAELPVLARAVSRFPVMAKVLCISGDAVALGSSAAPAKYGVVIDLDAFEATAMSQDLRAGMTLRAQTGYIEFRLLSLFSKDGNHVR